ncbi:MAG: 16S rRNA processing protein RimM [Clostridia bacterium]|nr:16S rRNA processing protein RimM [Clostridia bacterium]
MNIEIGRILNTHGVRGEVKAEIYCDPALLRGLQAITVGGAEYTLKSFRGHGAFFLLTLEGVDSIGAAMPLKGKPITAERETLPLKQGEYLFSDIYGFDVFDTRTQQVIGTLSEVLERPASMIYRVTGEIGESLIPAAPPFYQGVNFEEKRLLVATIEGMLPNED